MGNEFQWELQQLKITNDGLSCSHGHHVESLPCFRGKCRSTGKSVLVFLVFFFVGINQYCFTEKAGTGWNSCFYCDHVFPKGKCRSIQSMQSKCFPCFPPHTHLGNSQRRELMHPSNTQNLQHQSHQCSLKCDEIRWTLNHSCCFSLQLLFCYRGH